jgi:anthranilate phosphoribosyltransferase
MRGPTKTTELFLIMRNQYLNAEHPFAQYVRILGKGKSSSRSLSLDEARDAMAMIVAGDVEPVQLGAFLMLLRVKEESPEELAGFVMAAKNAIEVRRDKALKSAGLPAIAVDLDWSSYAGKRKHYPWFLLAVKLLCQHGVRIFMHGASGHTSNRLYTEAVLPSLDLAVCQSWAEASAAIANNNFAYLPVRELEPVLDDMIQLRSLLGLRSPVHTLTRLLNPTQAPAVMQAIFHPAYRESHQRAALLLGYANSCVIKGEGGEIERNPDGTCLAKRVVNGEPVDEDWPMIFEQRHNPEDLLSDDVMLRVWHGEQAHEYGEMAIISTVALTLRTLALSDTPESAMVMATSLWQQRHNTPKKPLIARP